MIYDVFDLRTRPQGFDWPPCSAVVFATPFTTSGATLEQAIGRAQRGAATSTTVVDFADASPALAAAAEKRRAWFVRRGMQLIY